MELNFKPNKERRCAVYILYSIDTQNKRLPSERAVHVVDTELAERFFVSYTTQSERAVKKVVNEIDDFIGDQAKDLTKPLAILGINGDSFGLQLIAEILKKQPVYVDCKASTLNKAFR